MSVEPRLYFDPRNTIAVTMENCFYCGKHLPRWFIHWAGLTGDISLHPGCTVELTIRLYRDLHQIECITHIDMTEQALADFRQQLRHQEGLR